MISLSEFLSTIGQAGTTAAQAAAQHNQGIFQSYFRRVAGKLVPRTLSFLIAGRAQDVPVAVLQPNKRMEIKRLVVSFASDVDLTPEGRRERKIKSPGNPELDLTLKSGLFGKSTRITVTATFVAVAEPESVEKIRDRLNTALGRNLDG